jgi:pyroglutamyl-peptidase
MFFFPYADEKGYKPLDDPILPAIKKEDSLTTSLPLSAIHEEFQLNSQSIGANNDAVEISTYPGFFVCNYVYYKSLLHQKSKGSPLNSLFIHVPPSDPQATDHEATVVQIVKQLITSVCKACFQ